MIDRLLNRLEETLIAFLMAAATLRNRLTIAACLAIVVLSAAVAVHQPAALIATGLGALLWQRAPLRDAPAPTSLAATATADTSVVG